jgi:hypothetical protein
MTRGWACIDQNGNIVTMDDSGPTKTLYTLLSWLEAWVSGVDMSAETFEVVDGIMTYPFTKKSMALIVRAQLAELRR